MIITREIVNRVANLAMLKLSEEEVALFTSQLDTILQYFVALQEVDTSDIEPTFHALPISNVFRDDHLEESLTLDECLQNAPETKDNMFVVPKII